MQTEEANYGAEEWRQPVPDEGDEVIYSEHGRIAFNTDFRSHSYKLVKNGNSLYLLVRHGGGDERHKISWRPLYAETLAPLSSDYRYLAMDTLLDLIHEARKAAVGATSAHFRKAFAEGRLKKRKMPGRNACKIWIESERAA